MAGTRALGSGDALAGRASRLGGAPPAQPGPWGRRPRLTGTREWERHARKGTDVCIQHGNCEPSPLLAVWPGGKALLQASVSSPVKGDGSRERQPCRDPCTCQRTPCRLSGTLVTLCFQSPAPRTEENSNRIHMCDLRSCPSPPPQN